MANDPADLSKRQWCTKGHEVSNAWSWFTLRLEDTGKGPVSETFCLQCVMELLRQTCGVPEGKKE